MNEFSWNSIREDFFFWKSVTKIRVSLKSDKDKRTLRKQLCKFVIISRLILLSTINVSNSNCRENQNTHFLFSKFFSWKSYLLWDVKKYGTTGQTKGVNIGRRMRTAWRITKATDTHSEYVNTYCFPTVTMVPRMRLNFTSHVLCPSYYHLLIFPSYFITQTF